MTQVFDDDSKKEYHLKRLFELSKKNIGAIPQLEDPNGEQLDWIKRKMRASGKSWEAYNHV